MPLTTPRSAAAVVHVHTLLYFEISPGEPGGWINIKVAAGTAFEISVILTPCQVKEFSPVLTQLHQSHRHSPWIIRKSVCKG